MGFVFQLLIVMLANGDNLHKQVTIIGNAQDTKSGAIVVARDTKVIYYLDGVSHWDEHIVEHEVSVTGRLSLEKTTADDSQDIRQEIVGVKRVIKKPRWKVLN